MVASDTGPVSVVTKLTRTPPPDDLVWHGDVEKFLDALPQIPVFDLVVTSPPYNLGKHYERKQELEIYLAWQERIIRKLVPLVKATGSICWQVGNFVENGEI